MTKNNRDGSGCCSGMPDCNSGSFDRRSFLKISGASAILASGICTPASLAEAIPPSRKKHLIPIDKNLSSKWVRLLAKQNEPEIYSLQNQDIKYIGMPIGGIGCGQLYLGGDGKLWLWDVFKSNYSREADHGQRFDAMTLNGHYTNPIEQSQQYHRDIGVDMEQGFAVNIQTGDKTESRTLDKVGFKDIRFRGEYPVGRVNYSDKKCPVKVELEAFSPFIPLNVKDSAIPSTIMSYTVKNTSDQPVSVRLSGWIENKVCPFVKDTPGYIRCNEIHNSNNNLTLSMSALSHNDKGSSKVRPDVLFEDFEFTKFGRWTSEGQAFGTGPVLQEDVPDYQGDLGMQGKRAVNSHAGDGAKPTETIGGREAKTGRLISPKFKILRKYIRFLIGGGCHPNKTGLRVVINGRTVCSATGSNDNKMHVDFLDVSQFQGQQAHLEVVDLVSEGWGNTGVDNIVFTDNGPESEIKDQLGYGSMALTLLDSGSQSSGVAKVDYGKLDEQIWSGKKSKAAQSTFGDKLIGSLTTEVVELKPGQQTTSTFIVSWWFPFYPGIKKGTMGAITNSESLRRYYAKHFSSAMDVAGYVTDNFGRLAGETRNWNLTWNDSTLPHWLLDRTFIAIDSLATQTSHYFDNERFWGWEGVDCCPGTCQHVWNYAQANARIFPKIDRDHREHVDFGLALGHSGESGHRGENSMAHFTDGQAGTIIRAWREHTTSPDNAYLKRIWPRIKKAMHFLIEHDPDKDGILTGAQHNTLDAAWYGSIAWISSVYCAALAACEQMALDAGDKKFAAECAKIYKSGSKKIARDLFNGEYFITKPDEKITAINTNIGCHVDQVLGQSWAMQTGLPRVLPKQQTVSALNALWKYNFAPDAGLYDKLHTTIKGARIYATEGESGLVMCTWPAGGDEKAVPGMAERVENGVTWLGPGGYFDECMTGFEYQVAAHMIYEGKAVASKTIDTITQRQVEKSLVLKGLAITRAVHDRYDASKRNPYNEIECSDHYARAMAGYGVFLAICGFEYHGPKGYIAFAPRLTPEKFKAPFTAAQGWGTFSQKSSGTFQTETIELKYGSLSLQKLKFELVKSKVKTVKVLVDDREHDATFNVDGSQVTVDIKKPILLKAGSVLEVVIA